MAQLDEATSARLDRATELLRSQRSPAPDRQARVWAALEGQLGGPPDGPADGGSSPSAGELGSGGSTPSAGLSWPYAAKVVGATLALTAAGLLGLGVVARVVQREAEPAQRSARAEPASVPASSPASSPGSIADETVPSGVEDQAPQAVSAPPPRSGQPSAGERAPRRAPDRAVPSAEASDIRAELVHIEAARVAASPQTALVELKAHARRFPNGSLADEREVLWVLASCELDQLKDAEARARRFLDRRPQSPLIDRMLTGCPALAGSLDDAK